MTPLTQILIATLAFGLTAFWTTRLRPGFHAKGETSHVSEREYYRLQNEATIKSINGLLLRMGAVWILIGAPALAYLPEGGFDVKIYVTALLGCLLLGIILSAVSYYQVSNFKSIDIDEDRIKNRVADELLYLVRQGGHSPEEIEAEYLRVKREATAAAQKDALARASEPLSDSNWKIAVWVLLAMLLVPLLLPLGAWASGLAIGWFVAVLIVLAVIDFFAYTVAIMI